ncbi:hypothetical protein [Aeromicrobium sp. 179-A 4D2 NHS]|uniref:hypothetical protein n=1 Tax=Aeromicrobium sp. 179-A 4D2 NHS TaxID=3142375 RepID=UPI00399F4232
MSTKAREDIDREVDEACYREPEYVCAWASGLMVTLLGSLPSQDPWRNLSAAIYPGDGRPPIIADRPGVPAPSVTGSRSAKRAFGTRRDVADMIVPEFSDWYMDLALAGVAEDLDENAAALIGFASHDFLSVLEAATYISSALVEERKLSVTSSGPTMREILWCAVTRVVHRRRVYSGQDDPFIVSQMFEWTVRARRWVDNPDPGRLPRVQQELVEQVEPYRIPDEDYERFSFT